MGDPPLPDRGKTAGPYSGSIKSAFVLNMANFCSVLYCSLLKSKGLTPEVIMMGLDVVGILWFLSPALNVSATYLRLA